jgi:hypothetical protein
VVAPAAAATVLRGLHVAGRLQGRHLLRQVRLADLQVVAEEPERRGGALARIAIAARRFGTWMTGSMPSIM